jgi:hypothetical protein
MVMSVQMWLKLVWFGKRKSTNRSCVRIMIAVKKRRSVCEKWVQQKKTQECLQVFFATGEELLCVIFCRWKVVVRKRAPKVCSETWFFCCRRVDMWVFFVQIKAVFTQNRIWILKVNVRSKPSRTQLLYPPFLR